MRMRKMSMGLVVITLTARFGLSVVLGQQDAEPSITTQPVVMDLPNEGFNNSRRSDPTFKIGPDDEVKRTDAQSMLLMSTAAGPNASGNAFCPVDLTPFLGKRVRVSAYLKSAGLTNWGGMGMVVLSESKHKWERWDTLGNQLIDGPKYRPLHGTVEWTRIEMVTDIPEDASQMMLGMFIQGPGRLWLDSARIEVVGDDVATTDDRNPHLYSDYAPHYSVKMDNENQREGHATVCVTPNHPPQGAHSWFGCEYRDPDEYLGHRIRLSAWMKCQGSSSEHLSLVAAVPRGPDKEIDNEAGQPAHPLTATWQQYEVTGTVPADTQGLVKGDFLFGSGKVWIDDMKIEIIDGEGGTGN